MSMLKEHNEAECPLGKEPPHSPDEISYSLFSQIFSLI